MLAHFILELHLFCWSLPGIMCFWFPVLPSDETLGTTLWNPLNYTAVCSMGGILRLLCLSFFFLCTVTDFSAGALPISVKFYMAVWPHVGQVFSYFGGQSQRWCSAAPYNCNAFQARGAAVEKALSIKWSRVRETTKLPRTLDWSRLSSQRPTSSVI